MDSPQSAFAQPPSPDNYKDGDDLGEEELESEVILDAQDDDDDQEDILDEGQEQSDLKLVTEVNSHIQNNQPTGDEDTVTSFYLSDKDIRIGHYAITKVCTLVYMTLSLLFGSYQLLITYFNSWLHWQRRYLTVQPFVMTLPRSVEQLKYANKSSFDQLPPDGTH